jgi:hypothetical protein
MTPAERQSRHREKLKEQAQGGIGAAFRFEVRRVARAQLADCAPGEAQYIRHAVKAIEAMDDAAIRGHVAAIVGGLIQEARRSPSPKVRPVQHLEPATHKERRLPSLLPMRHE